MDAQAITFEVLGNPVPQPRARVSTRGGFARAYVPGKHPVHEYRSRLEAAAKAAGLTCTGVPLEIRIVATFERPKSHKRKLGLREGAPVLPRPDVDNIAKACLDSLQGVMGDDTHVARLAIEKRYGEPAGTFVTVLNMGGA